MRKRSTNVAGTNAANANVENWMQRLSPVDDTLTAAHLDGDALRSNTVQGADVARYIV
jgi:hypothetical protein